MLVLDPRKQLSFEAGFCLLGLFQFLPAHYLCNMLKQHQVPTIVIMN